MAKFATKTRKINPKTFDPDVRKTRNRAGGESYTLPVKTRLATRLLSAMIDEKMFYGDTTGNILNDIKECSRLDPEFVLKLAAFVRNEMFLRSAPVFTLGHAALLENCKPYVRKWAPSVLQRADEPAELIALIEEQFTKKGKKPIIPNSVKKGIADALVNFDAYQLMKYRGEGKAVNLYDVFNLCHPKPQNEEQAAMWNEFIHGRLEKAKTWESEKSRAGQTGKSSKAAWETAIPDMGYMAKLRNLRSFVDDEITDEAAMQVVSHLTSEKAVLNSKQFPFRFYSAWRELNDACGDGILFSGYWWRNERNKSDRQWTGKQKAMAETFMDALEVAVDISIKNVRLPGVTAVLSDHSGSMQAEISDKSTITRKEVALVLGAIADKLSPGGVYILFGDDAARVSTRGKTTLGLVKDLYEDDRVGHSTHAHKGIQLMKRDRLAVDRIILLSDMQSYSGSTKTALDDYRRSINSNVWMHSVDLAGYGTTLVPENDKKTALYGGWTTQFLELIPQVESGGEKLVERIDNYEPKS